MKKNTLRAIVAAAIVLIVYNLAVFIVPFAKTAVFWISWGFTLLAFCVVAAAIYIAFVKHPDAKSRFYGFPIARIGVIYGIAQLIVSIVFMALAIWIPWWVPVVVFAVGFAAAALGLISAEAVVEEIQQQDQKLKKDVSLMRSLQSKLGQMAAQCEEPAIQKLAEEFRYSDPVSSEAIAEAEADLVAVVDELQKAVVDEDAQAIRQLCRRCGALLAERNRLCKLNKN